MGKIVVLDAGTMGFGEEEWQEIAALGELIRYDRTDPRDDDLAVQRCAGAEIVLTNKAPMRAAVIERLPDLRLIATLATGFNQVDLDAATAAGIAVSNARGYSTPATAQHTVALILELANRVGLHSQSVKNGDWTRSPHFSYWQIEPVELQGLTAGIVGLGEIGRQVGRVLDAFGCKILGSMRTPRNPPDYRDFSFAETEEIFARADIITLHCPLTPENEKFVNADLLKTMKPNAFLINTARGQLIDEPALAQALREGTLAGAALDVVSSEPMSPDHPLLAPDIPNLILTPHMAWATRASRRRLLHEVAKNIKAHQAGAPTNTVNQKS